MRISKDFRRLIQKGKALHLLLSGPYFRFSNEMFESDIIENDPCTIEM